MGNNAGAPLIPTREVKNQLRELWGTALAMAIQQSKYFPCDFKAAFFKFMKSGKIGVTVEILLCKFCQKISCHDMNPPKLAEN